MLDMNQIRSMLEAELKSWDQVSVGVGIVKDGEVLLADGFGFADAEEGRKADGKTLYQIGSCSKAFTSAAAAVLVDQGKLKWDEPARNYLPWLKFKDPYVAEHVTVRDMLCHRTGLPRYDPYWICNPCTRKEMVENLKNMDSVCGFRAGWNYQNNCYAAVGMIIEEVSGMTWEAFVQKHLLDPIGMTRTTFYIDAACADDNHAKPYDRKPDDPMKGWQRIDWLKSPLEDWKQGIGAPWGPAGSIISCPEDMVKWMQFHLNKGKVGEEQIISEANMKELHKVNMVMDEPLIAKFPEVSFPSYGMGWFIDCYRGRKMIQHGGNINGFSTLTAMLPEQNAGIFVITNFDGSVMTYSAMYDIADRILGEQAEPSWPQRWHERMEKMLEAKKAAEGEEKRVEGTAPSHALADYAGTYRHDALGRVLIREQDGQLQIAYDFYDTFCKLEHWHYDTFKASDPACLINGMKARFMMSEDGTIDRVEIPLALDPRVPTTIFTRDAENKE